MLSRSLLGVACRHGRFHAAAKQFLQCGWPSVSVFPWQPVGESQSVKCLHMSPSQCNDEETTGTAKAKVKARKKSKLSKDVEKGEDGGIKAAAVEAAKSLPGDWTRTADELMSRLVMHGGKDGVEDKEVTEERPESILATMQVGRGFERRKDQMQRRATPSRSGDSEVAGFSSTRRRLPIGRSQEVFTKVFSQPPLGIFDPKTFKEEEVEEEIDLWREKDMENLHKRKGTLARNAFEEMIQWTKEGKMWTYPIDNEADMHEERKYQFHEHIFLERHLEQFPSQGPLRRFMELVVVGLSKNPWVSVPEKVEHIQWFADYFREKQKLLEPTLGEQAKLKDMES